ncbi:MULTISPECIES: peptidase M23 [Bacillus]|uniref:peptidase M23 n=1 Tax=Bacillus TaxID=1386 RepID=UPI00273F303D|nr:peptidase M23 [Bacillus sp. MMSF_3328]
MGTSLRTFYLCLIWAGIMTMQLNFTFDSTATRGLRDSLELATHDAGLQISNEELVNGKIVFDQSEARRVLEESLKKNLLLDASLQPKTGSFFQDTVQIKFVDYLDDNNTPEFPTNYINDQYDIVDVVDGPAIVVVLETTGPRYFTGEKKIIRQAIVYEYKS